MPTSLLLYYCVDCRAAVGWLWWSTGLLWRRPLAAIRNSELGLA